MTKLRVGVLFGGRSGEHEVSLLSAASVLAALDRDRYEVVPIGITREGRWVTASDAELLLRGPEAQPGSGLRAGDPQATASAAVLARGEAAIMPPEPGAGLLPFETVLPEHGRTPHHDAVALDVVLPVVHGTNGEDGTLQGLLELAGLPYVGSGVLGSAAGMDKDMMKRLFAAAGLPMVPHVTLLRRDWEAQPDEAMARVEAALRYPVFAKPANGGSSVGISKARDRAELEAALALAARYDRKLVVEQAASTGKARELEVAVLGNDRPEASVVGEIIPAKDFYDYEAKYLSEGSVPVIPAEITPAEAEAMRAMAVRAFEACDCAGLARVDFLMEPDGERRVYLNEINTLPGFTAISMYPKLWAASGLAYPALLDRLIALALERAGERGATSYSRS